MPTIEPMEHEARPDDVFREDPYDASGVDRSLIRWMLSLSPIERLRCLAEQSRFVLEARRHVAKRER